MREQARRHVGTKARRAILLLVVGACATFAFWPLRPEAIETPKIEVAPPVARQVAALDIAAFRAPIWVAEPPPPPPVAAVPAPPPPPPLKIQLLAIVREGEVYKAAVYDPDSDRILVVASGEKLGTRMVEQVDQGTLTLRDGTAKRVLALKDTPKDGGVP